MTTETAILVGVAIAAPIVVAGVIYGAGFTATGVVHKSFAAGMMAKFGTGAGAGAIVSSCQAAGAVGTSVATKIITSGAAVVVAKAGMKAVGFNAGQ